MTIGSWQGQAVNDTDPASVYADLRWATEFTITDSHIKLLGRAYTGWNYCEFGAPGMDPKRPYGNNNVLADIAEILEIDVDDDRARWKAIGGVLDDDEYDMSPPLITHLTRLHAEMGLVLAIGFRTLQFKAGRYVRSQKWSEDWKAAE